MAQTSTETFAFSADISQLLSIIINTFYANKEIFLRELISNASDALDKIRYASLTDPEAMGARSDLEIKLEVDKESNTLTVTDTGIGMTKEELVNNLGTIAKSGTKGFMEALQAGADISMIGQFGVGFYSAYLVADKVTVYSRANGCHGWCWESDAGGAFTVRQEETEYEYGTKVILHMKESQREYLEEANLKALVVKHSNFISFPISLLVEKTIEKEVAEEESADEDDNDDNEDGDQPKVEDVVEDVAGNMNDKSSTNKKMKTIKEVCREWEQLNKEKPIWMQTPSEVSQEQYASFYKTISHDWEDHLAVKHFAVEGQLEFRGIFFTPKRKPFDMFRQLNRKKKNIKLYVRRVFVTDTFEDLVPEYLRFVRGIIDSEDLPLNISREVLQQSKIIGIIKKHIVKKIIEMFTELSGEDFTTFYNNFSKNIKLGVYEDTANRAKLMGLLRFQSTKSDGELVSLEDYVSRMGEKQEKIYFIAGESLEHVSSTPFLERLRQKDIECLYMTDAIDEYLMQQVHEYKGKKFVSVTQEGFTLEEDDEEKREFEEAKKRMEPLCALVKEILGDDVVKVVVSSRVVDSPCCLVTGQHGWSANMERIVGAQTLDDNNPMGPMSSQKTMELNPKHHIVTALYEKMETNKQDPGVRDLVHLLYDVALVSSGFSIKKPATFAKAIHGLISLGLSLDIEDSEEESDVEEAIPLVSEGTETTAELSESGDENVMEAVD